MITIYRSEASASLRRIPLWLVASDGTSAPSTQAAGQPQINWLARGTATVNTSATLSAVSVNAGEYYVELTASEVSALGIAAIHYRSAACPPASTYFQITNFDSGNSVDLGLTSFSGVTLHAGTHSGATVQGVTRINSNVTLNADTHSGATIQGLSNYANISTVTLHAGTHSGATVNAANVTLLPAEYSDVTVRIGLVSYSGASVGVLDIKPASYSGVSVGVASIAPATYSGVTFETSNIGRSSMQSMADRFLLRALATGSDTGRIVQDALRPLRNRVAVAGSIMTVYTEDDATSAWTSSIATSAVASPIIGFDPSGP